MAQRVSQPTINLWGQAGQFTPTRSIQKVMILTLKNKDHNFLHDKSFSKAFIATG